MATLKLPTFKNNLNHRYSIVLDGETIAISFHYNARSDRWTTSFFDVENAAIRHGVKLVLADDLLQRVALATKPPGTFACVDTTGNDTEPNADTFGIETQFRYVEADG